MFYSIIAIYLGMAGCFVSEWISFFLADDKMSREQRYISYIILFVSTMFWPVVVPFAYLELLKFHKKHKAVINLLIKSSNSSVIDE
jgi:hypothetical protein